MMSRINKVIGALCVGALVVAAGQQASGAIVTQPTGETGDYRLIFVTSTTTQATESSAEYYNDFVYDLAVSVPELAALNTTWTVAGNLNGIGPWENTGTEGDDDIPIYRLDDQVFAADYTALKGAPTIPVAITETGEVASGGVWTGMGETMSVPTYSSTTYIGYGGSVGRAQPNYTWYTWGQYTEDPETENHLYAMSGVIPEPATGGLLLLGATAFLGLLRRKLHG